jgi:hypothetical protein
MPQLLRPLWFILASLSARKLSRMIEYFKEENRMLRSRLPRNITVTQRERGLLIIRRDTFAHKGRPVNSVCSAS